MEKLRTNKGITLIALVITIIVMLILVTVSIQVALNTGLFESAGKATKEWSVEQDKEQELASGTITIEDKTYGSIEEYLAGKEKTEENHDWTRNGDTLNCKCTTCTESNAEGRTLTIGQELNYTEGGVATVTLSGAETGVAEGLSNGDLSADEKIQSDGTQTISRDAETKWVVLGREDSNGNNTYETLLLTTATPTEDWFYMYGAAGYNNAITTENTQGVFDKVCKTLYGNEARSMTIEDVNNCLQYTPVGGEILNNSSYKTTGNLTTKLKKLPEEIWNAIRTNEYGTKTPNPDDEDSEEYLGEYEVNGYSYYVSNDGETLVNDVDDTTATITTATRDLIFGQYVEDWESYEYYYWLASRGVSVSTSMTFYQDGSHELVGRAYFGPGSVGEGGANSYNGLFFSLGRSRGGYLSVRAVVSLTSEIPAVVE